MRKTQIEQLYNGVIVYLTENDKTLHLTFNNLRDAQIVSRVWQTSEPIKLPHTELSIEID